METKMNGKLKDAYRNGAVVLILLATFTMGEYFLGSIAVGWIMPLFLIALLKAALIVRDYMHLPRLFAAGEEEHP